MNGIECAFTGRLGRDPELKMVKGGTLAMITMSVVVEGVGDDSPMWIRTVTFGEKAEELSRHLTKGDRIYCEGKLVVDLWQPEDGRQTEPPILAIRPA